MNYLILLQYHVRQQKDIPSRSLTLEQPFYLVLSMTIFFILVFSSGSPEKFTIDVLVSLLRQENAVDICVIKVPEQITYSEYFIVVSGVSPRHLRAMALYAIKVVTNIYILIAFL